MKKADEEQVNNAIKLIGKSLSGALTVAEQGDLQVWLDKDTANKSLYHELMDPMYRKAQLQNMGGYTDEETALRNFRKRMGLLHHTPATSTKLWLVKLKWIGAAAAVLIAVLSTVFILNLPKDNDLAPGSNLAYIRLPNGKTITLSSAKTGVAIAAGKLAYTDGTRIVAEAAQPYDDVVVSTPRGGQYQVKLPDGTIAFLNAASSLTFPTSFTGKERRVVLTGEAYFSVVHNEKIPFRVQTKGQVVEDIGTAFNISAYTEENTIKTTLIEGSAKVSIPYPGGVGGGTREVILTPGKQSTLLGQILQVTQVDSFEAIAWKDGYFYFNHENLESIMNKIARWYDVSVQYNDPELKQQIFSGSVSRFKTASQVLDKLELTEAVTFKIEGRRIIVMKTK